MLVGGPPSLLQSLAVFAAAVTARSARDAAAAFIAAYTARPEIERLLDRDTRLLTLPAPPLTALLTVIGSL